MTNKMSILHDRMSRERDSQAFEDGMSRKAKELDEYIDATIGMFIRDKNRDKFLEEK